MKVNRIECDCCGENVQRGDLWAILKRPFLRRWKLKILSWSMAAINPVDSGWRKDRIDLCEDCWKETIETVKEKTNG